MVTPVDWVAGPGKGNGRIAPTRPLQVEDCYIYVIVQMEFCI